MLCKKLLLEEKKQVLENLWTKPRLLVVTVLHAVSPQPLIKVICKHKDGGRLVEKKGEINDQAYVTTTDDSGKTNTFRQLFAT